MRTNLFDDRVRNMVQQHPAKTAGLFALFLYGLGLRLWMTTQPLGTLDSDMAILGLMARRVQEFEFTTFHWGQYYGGAQEAYLAGLLGIFTGVDKFVLQLTTIVLSFTAAVALWFAAKEIIGRRAALVAAALFWVWPGPFVWWSVKIGSNYWFAATVALVSVYLLAKLRDHEPTNNRLIVLGVTLGLTFWANPQAAYIVVPAVIAYWRPLWRGRRSFVWLFAGAAVGAGPWIAFNIAYQFPSLDPSSGEVSISPVDGVKNLFQYLIPEVLGFRIPFDGRMLFGAVGTVCAIAVGIGLVAGALKVRHEVRLPILALLGGLAFFIFSPGIFYITQPRYLFWISPWLVMVIAVIFVKASKQKFAVPALLVLATTVTTVQLVHMNESPLVGYRATDATLPFDDASLITLLEDNNVTHAYASYWIAYRVTFETNEDIIVAPYYTDRHPEYTEEVDNADRSAHIFLTESKLLTSFLDYCRSVTACPTVERGGFTLVLPEQPITSADPNVDRLVGSGALVEETSGSEPFIPAD